MELPNLNPDQLRLREAVTDAITAEALLHEGRISLGDVRMVLESLLDRTETLFAMKSEEEVYRETGVKIEPDEDEDEWNGGVR